MAGGGLNMGPPLGMVFGGADEALREVARHLIARAGATEVETRNGRAIRFDTPFTLALHEPRARIPLCLGRDLNPWVTLAEFPWLMAGRNDVAWLEPYLPRAKDFADDGEHWRAGYGPRMAAWGDGPGQVVDQLQGVFQALQRDPDTRRAVVSIWDPGSDQGPDWKDVPCTLSLVFRRAHGALDLHVTMRSNDLWWGLTGVNLVNWTLLQEALALLLGWPVGRYYHTATDLHLYETHWAAARSLKWGPPCYRGRDATSMEPLGVATLAGLRRAASDAVHWVEATRGDVGRLADLEVVAHELGAREDDWMVQWAYFMHLWPWFSGALTATKSVGEWAAVLSPVTRWDWRLAAVEYLSRQAHAPRMGPLCTRLQVPDFWRGALAEAQRKTQTNPEPGGHNAPATR